MQDKIKVLIVDDVPQTRTDIRRLLYFEDDMEVVGESENGKAAIEAVSETFPDVILMDINMPIMDGIRATEKITALHPQVSIIIISIQGEQEYLKKAMIAGARDYLVKPLSSEDMSTTIRQVYKMGKRRKEKKETSYKSLEVQREKSETVHNTIAIFSGKGGVGKTVLASNLAVALAQKKLKVALLDLDLQFGDVAVMFNLNENATINDLVQEESKVNEELLDRFLIRHISGVHILPAPHWPQEEENIKAEFVDNLIKTLQKSFDCILIDTPTYFNEVSLLVLEKADLILSPVRREICAIKSVKITKSILDALNYGDKTKVVLNQANLDLGIEIKNLERNLDLGITHLITNDERTVLTSINKGVPFIIGNSNSEISKDIKRLSEKVIRGFSYKKNLDKKSIVGKLFSF